ncbi:hypothetical protein EC973_002436 [Apophysomyces ossiformis]|uniref:Uncharacterized protein n=1 Tax=Apophysomyces ossiformis TaxID=679940 RepID=A0A8H7BJ26_9FUNG|nr:hypothetical protein EC973_002436 [Apophysomyces ossiformis]
MDYLPGRKSEYYLQHYDDGDDDDNLNLVFSHNDQEVDDHGAAVSNDEDTDNDRSDKDRACDDDEDTHGVIEYDKQAAPDNVYPNSIWAATGGHEPC